MRAIRVACGASRRAVGTLGLVYRIAVVAGLPRVKDAVAAYRLFRGGYALTIDELGAGTADDGIVGQADGLDLPRTCTAVCVIRCRRRWKEERRNDSAHAPCFDHHACSV